MAGSVVGILIAQLLVGQAVVAQEYEIRLHRALDVGQKYNVVSKGSIRMDMIMNAAGEDDAEGVGDKTSFDLDFDVEVLAVNAKKAPTSVKAVVNKFTTQVKSTGEKTVAIKKGAVITGKVVDGEEEFEVDGEELDEEGVASKIVSSTLSLADNDFTDDDTFGTKNKVKVGDKWDVNAAMAAEDLKSSDIEVRKEDIKGSCTLKELVDVEGQKCLRIEADMMASSMKVPSLSGMKVNKASFRATMKGLFPVDTAKLPVEESIKVTMNITMAGPARKGEPAVTIDSKMVVIADSKQKLLKP
ncbi:MAG: hypothetical protein C0404_05045 [Verrucomicrobia bacterium]|nr:hypothetical protein [Verrucomicrobiota bacterium]